MNYHVVIPFNRPQHLKTLLAMYKPAGVILHLLDSTDVPLTNEPWVEHVKMVAPKDWCDTGAPCYWKINEWIKSHESIIAENDYVRFHCDDDAPGKGFWSGLKTHDDDIIINTVKVHPTYAQTACEQNMVVGYVGMTQYTIKMKLLRGRRFLNKDWADGQFAVDLKNAFSPLRYAPELFMVWNAINPAHWPNNTRPELDFQGKYHEQDRKVRIDSRRSIPSVQIHV